MRRFLPLVLLVAAGCSEKPGPAFKDEAQEARYLETIANPTPEQFKRREELTQNAKDRVSRIAYHEAMAGNWYKAARQLEEDGKGAEALTEWEKVADQLKEYPESERYQEAAAAVARLKH